MEQTVQPSAKWGEAAKAGFQILPDLLFRKQAALGLSAIDLVVLANITMHWWYADQRPFPRSSIIAARAGVETRTVQRSIKKMEGLGLISKVVEKHGPNGERLVCDLSGLVNRLAEFAKQDPDYLTRTNRMGTASDEAPF